MTTTDALRLVHGGDIDEGYGRQAVFGMHAQRIDLDDEVQFAHLMEHGGDLSPHRARALTADIPAADGPGMFDLWHSYNNQCFTSGGLLEGLRAEARP